MKRFSLIFVLLSILLFFSSCGKKGPLLPPLPKIPKKVEVFDIIQRGDRVLLEWKNPQSYTDGSPLAEIDEVEVWLYEGEKESLGKKEFEESARLVTSIRKEEFPFHQIRKGDASSKLQYFYKLTARDFGPRNLIFGLRVKEKKKRKSEFSELFSLKPIILSLPPPKIQAHVFENRIEIKWDPPEKNTDQSSPPHFKGYNIYRAEGEGLPLRLNPELVKERKYEDKDFLFERPYRYFVRASGTESSPYLESDDSQPVEILAQDKFPPTVPTGLVSVAGENLISLSWDRSQERDLAGYRVWRKIEGQEEYVLLTSQPIQENAYNDTRVEKNKRYYYAITAQDKSGNESLKSECVSETLKDKF